MSHSSPQNIKLLIYYSERVESSMQYTDGKDGGNSKYGLCYQVKCVNQDCTSFGQLVVSPLGYGVSTFGRDRWRCACPTCKELCDGGVVDEVVATNCKWAIDGYTDKGILKHDEGRATGTQVLSMVTRHVWTHLEITTTALSDP